MTNIKEACRALMPHPKSNGVGIWESDPHELVYYALCDAADRPYNGRMLGKTVLYVAAEVVKLFVKEEGSQYIQILAQNSRVPSSDPIGTDKRSGPNETNNIFRLSRESDYSRGR